MPKKILHLTYDMSIGGTEQVIYQLVTGLDKDKFTCSIACIEKNLGPIGETLSKQGMQFYVLDRSPGFDTSLITKLKKIIVDGEVDIIHCHQYTPYVYGVLSAINTSAAVVFTEHGRFYPDRYSWKRRLVNPLLGKMTGSITAISTATADALAEYEWFSRKSIEVVYNGLIASTQRGRREKRSEIGINENTIVFGTITRFDPIKNLPLLVDAFARVNSLNPDTRLLLVGDGDDAQKIKQQVVNAGLQDQVFFTGYQNDTVAYMSSIDVFVLSSLSEGTSMTLLEAMSLGVCCLVTDVGGNTEIIDHNANGIVVPSGHVDALAQSMEILASDPILRGRLSRAGKESFYNRFELGKMVEKYSAIYCAQANR